MHMRSRKTKYEAWGGRFQLAGNDDRAGTDPHHVGDIRFVEPVPVIGNRTVTNAYNTTVSLRQARDNASVAADRVLGDVSNAAIPNTIRWAADADGIVDISGRSENGTTLADGCDVSDQIRDLGEHGLPQQPGFELGTGATQLTFGYTGSGGSAEQRRSTSAPTVLHRPCQLCRSELLGRMAWVPWRKGQIVLSFAAVDLWGGTGPGIHGWRLYASTGGGYQWLRQ